MFKNLPNFEAEMQSDLSAIYHKKNSWWPEKMYPFLEKGAFCMEYLANFL